MTTTQVDPAFEELLRVLFQSHHFDFSGYRRSTLVRRVQRRMDILGISTFADYADHLEVHADEFSQLFNTILINVTSFFRDPDAWEFVSTEVIPGCWPSGAPAIRSGCGVPAAPRVRTIHAGASQQFTGGPTGESSAGLRSGCPARFRE